MIAACKWRHVPIRVRKHVHRSGRRFVSRQISLPADPTGCPYKRASMIKQNWGEPMKGNSRSNFAFRTSRKSKDAIGYRRPRFEALEDRCLFFRKQHPARKPRLPARTNNPGLRGRSNPDDRGTASWRGQTIALIEEADNSASSTAPTLPSAQATWPNSTISRDWPIRPPSLCSLLTPARGRSGPASHPRAVAVSLPWMWSGRTPSRRGQASLWWKSVRATRFVGEGNAVCRWVAECFGRIRQLRNSGICRRTQSGPILHNPGGPPRGELFWPPRATATLCTIP